MKDTVAIERAREVDAELREAMARLLPQLSSSASIPSVEELREIVAAPGTLLLLAREPAEGRRIVGMLTLALFRIPTGMRAWIEDVVVDAGVRGHGAGKALTREAIRLASDMGARTVDLTSRPSREAANRMYRALGFVPRDTNVYRHTIPPTVAAGTGTAGRTEPA